jgi:general secretion pathway protein I
VRRRRGLTLLEVLVALAVLALGITALQRLLTRSIATVAADAQASRAMVLARALLAEANVRPPEPGHSEGVRGGLRFEREVTPLPHPGLRRITVRVSPPSGGAACELVELVRVPAA